MERTISTEGLNYSGLDDNSMILKEYPSHESKEAHDKGINLSMSYPEFGFRNVILNNKNILLIGRKNDKTLKAWKGVTK